MIYYSGLYSIKHECKHLRYICILKESEKSLGWTSLERQAQNEASQEDVHRLLSRGCRFHFVWKTCRANLERISPKFRSRRTTFVKVLSSPLLSSNLCEGASAIEEKKFMHLWQCIRIFFASIVTYNENSQNKSLS